MLFLASYRRRPTVEITNRSSGSKPAPVEGKIAEFLASFGPSPAKANKHIILYSERYAVQRKERALRRVIGERYTRIFPPT